MHLERATAETPHKEGPLINPLDIFDVISYHKCIYSCFLFPFPFLFLGENKEEAPLLMMQTLQVVSATYRSQPYDDRMTCRNAIPQEVMAHVC